MEVATESGIGERLRNAREAKGLTLQAMEGVTHIRALYLQALEDEQFDRLPGPVYAKGFLRTYASALGLDPDRLIEAYPRALDAPAQSLVGMHPIEIPIQAAAPRSPLRRAAMYAGAILLAGLVVVGVIGYLQLRQFSAPVPPEAVTPPEKVPAPSAEPAQPLPEVPEPPQTGREAERPRPAIPPPVPAGGVNLEVRASDTSWIRVIADGEQVFQGLVEAGDVRTWHAERSLTVRVGNVPAVQVLVNGEVVQPKTRGRVWEETFDADAR